MPSLQDPSIVVVDNGTGVVKAGFAGDRLPRQTFPCVVGRTSKRRSNNIDLNWPQQTIQGPVLGHDALEQNDLDLSYPMANGVVRNWDDMRLIWDHTWSQLGATPSESKVLLTDPALNPTANKQRMIEIMLEEQGFQAAGMQVQAVLSLYAHGLHTGVVLDSGDGVSHAVSVVQGFAFSHLTQRLELAGRHITEHLMELLIRRGATLHRVHDLDWVRRIKEASCYVAVDLERERRLASETTCIDKSYTLPDGRIIKVGTERFMAPEALFNPILLDKERPGIANMLFNAINECDVDNRRELYDHVVISGGSTMFPGLPTRLEADLKQLYVKHVLQGDTSRLQGMKMCVYDNADRQNMVFRGASVFAGLTQHHPESWVTLSQWQEEGPIRCLKRLGVMPT